jgi:toxin secretion/phage lysis holin
MLQGKVTLLDRFVSLFADHALAKFALSVPIALLTALFGQYEVAHQALAFLIIFDTFTGVWRAAKEGRLRSRKMIEGGLYKLGTYAIFLATANQLYRMEDSLQLLRTWSFVFLGATEALSIIENLHHLKFILPKWVSARLHYMLEKDPFKQ